MAVNDYYNRGRVEGVQKSTALDNLERILGIGQGVAQNIQKGRDKRSDAFKIRMSSILDIKPNQEALHKRTFNNDLIVDAKKRFIANVGTGINRANLETRELYNSYIKEMDREMELNDAYNVEKGGFAKKEGEFLEEVQNYILNQGDINFNSSEALQKITDKINTYSSSKADFMGKYGNKIAYDEPLMGDMTSFVFTAQKFLSEVKKGNIGDTAMIPDPLYNMLTTGLSSDNPEIAKSAVRQYDNNRSAIFQSNFNAAETDIAKNQIKVEGLLNEKALHSGTNQTEAWGKWPEYQMQLNELYENYDTFYQVSNERHVNDPLHKGNIEDYRMDLINDFMQDGDVNSLLGGAYTNDDIEKAVNDYANKVFDKGNWKESKAYQYTGVGGKVIQVPGRAVDRTVKAFKSSVLKQMTNK